MPGVDICVEHGRGGREGTSAGLVAGGYIRQAYLGIE
jgi:hypothetical protein